MFITFSVFYILSLLHSQFLTVNYKLHLLSNSQSWSSRIDAERVSLNKEFEVPRNRDQR
jgi:hypothetical protein